MKNIEKIYFSLDEAREELQKRCKNIALKDKVNTFLGSRLLPGFGNKPRSVLFRQVCPADNGFVFFYFAGKYLNAEPLVIEYGEDIFVHFNEEKKGLGRLRVFLEDGAKTMIDLMNFHENEKKKLKDVKLKTGETLVDFHHKLFDILGLKAEMIDCSQWFKSFNKAENYYYYFMLHFVVHGVLFEVFQTEEDASEDIFTKNVVMPAISRIKEEFGLAPLVVRLYPKNQTDEEDFFWWCYPPKVNNFIATYARKI